MACRGCRADRGILHPKTGIDYFVFRRGFYKEIPPFAIGRTIWDNWLLYNARFQRFPMIDATSVITVIHQSHEYGFSDVKEGPEAKHNLELAGGYSHVFSIQDATHILRQKGLKLALTKEHLRRHFETIPVLFPKTAPFIYIVRCIIRPLLWLKRIFYNSSYRVID